MFSHAIINLSLITTLIICNISDSLYFLESLNNVYVQIIYIIKPFVNL